jgi:hypothetical protein
MGAGRTTTGTVIGGLLAMHGYGTPPAPLGASGGVSGGGGLPPTAALGAAGAFGSALPPPIAVGTGPMQQQQGSGPSAAAAAAAAAGVGALRVEGPEGLVAELNEGQTRDILREEIAGDSPRCSGGCCCQGIGESHVHMVFQQQEWQCSLWFPSEPCCSVSPSAVPWPGSSMHMQMSALVFQGQLCIITYSRRF